jgi:hypothetical protein
MAARNIDVRYRLPFCRSAVEMLISLMNLSLDYTRCRMGGFLPLCFLRV